jgi:hypothetical protein
MGYMYLALSSTLRVDRLVNEHLRLKTYQFLKFFFVVFVAYNLSLSASKVVKMTQIG